MKKQGRVVFVFQLLLLVWAASPAWALEPLTLQLKWTHGFQFAGYYAARAQGYYRDAGFDVRFLPARPGVDVVEEVLAGRADYGVGTSSLLLDRQAGKPIVVLATIMQHSPQVFIVQQHLAINGVQDLIGRLVMLEAGADELLVFLSGSGVAVGQLRLLPHSYDANDFIGGKVDAFSAYLSQEPFLLQQAGQPYKVFTPRSAGYDFYGDNLFTSEQELRARPERVAAFRAASLRGWEYALAHPEETVDMIRRHYAPNLSREYLLFEAGETAQLVRADLLEIGYMKRERWTAIARAYAEAGLLPKHFPMTGFLYDPDNKLLLGQLKQYLALAATFILLGGLLAAYIYRINLRLRKSLAALKRTHEQLNHMAHHDALTDLPNRALFFDRMASGLALAKRNQESLALMFIDLDKFKPINDTYGHSIGDLLLKEVARRLLTCVRDSDTVGRFGGDEFVVLLNNIKDRQGILAVADKIRGALEEPVRVGGLALSISSSIGIALYPEHGDSELELARRADLAMYQAKHEGRDRVVVYRSGMAPCQPAPDV